MELTRGLMENKNNLTTILKWIGLGTLIALPVVLFIKRLKERQEEAMVDDEADIYAED